MAANKPWQLWSQSPDGRDSWLVVDEGPQAEMEEGARRRNTYGAAHDIAGQFIALPSGESPAGRDRNFTRNVAMVATATAPDDARARLLNDPRGLHPDVAALVRAVDALEAVVAARGLPPELTAAILGVLHARDRYLAPILARTGEGQG